MNPRRMPTKAELIRLQKLYRTDKRIAETLGNGVTEHLVAYWRRKKGIPTYSFPKFSVKEIREVWDRFGDDFHAGMELGLSKAAFYNWRRRYKITRKPAALKLEQLSLELFTGDTPGRKRLGSGHQTIVQKVLSRSADCKSVDIGQEVEIEPEMVIAGDSIDEVIESFNLTGTTYVWNPARVLIPLDGTILSVASGEAERYKSLRDFSRLQQIQNTFDLGEGDGLQVAMEKGLVLPGQVILGCDKTIFACGCLGVLTLKLSASETALVWAEGKVGLTVPETVRVNLTGRLSRGVFVRDVAHHIIAQTQTADMTGKMIEFYGTAIDQMSISERFTLCSIMQDTGCAGVVCPYDATTRRYINPRARKPFTPALADRNAVYVAEFTFDLNIMKAVVSGLAGPGDLTPINEMGGLAVHYVFMGGAVNGRFDDLKIVAEIIKGKKINPLTRLFIQPASRAIYLDALKRGLIRVFAEAGAIVISPGDPRRLDLQEVLAPDENGLTTYHHEITRPGGRLYQVSPATAAVSALTGEITHPAPYVKF